MTEPVVVTGGSGVLGRVVVDRLRASGRAARVVSRTERADPEWAAADVVSGEGLDAALAGAGAVIHCASSQGSTKKDVTAMRNLVAAARRSECPHLVYVSIVGVDRVPYGYYQAKFAAEQVLEHSGVPHTIQRATQFHDLLRVILAWAARSPVMPVPDVSDQPIEVADVADRLVELAASEPCGRADDMGGPETREIPDFARAYLTATGRNRRLLRVRLPGATFRAYRDGGHLTPDHPIPGRTFEEYLRRHPAPASTSYRA